ncbi:MAG TPA: efflux RND transporter periplasmic adaptor subunit [Azospirillaceae bacterium]|nr:efflux RND transporter periplasmic adaptor subunit [Azospirillaceae bacterium]
MRFPRPTALIGVLLLLALLAGGAWLMAGRGDGGPGRPEAQAPGSPGGRAMVVDAAIAAEEPVESTVGALGTLRSDAAVAVQPEAAGRIVEIAFAEGQRVAQGQPLFVLDQTTLKAELAEAQAQLRLAEQNYQRATSLARQGAGTGRALDEARAALDVARSAEALAAERLDDATVRAPFDGYAGLHQESAGQYVTTATVLTTLDKVDPMRVDFRVSEVFLPRVAVGQPIRLTVDALPGREFEGRVYALDPRIDVNGRALQIRAEVANPEHLLRPGLFARVRLVLERRDRSVTVPEAAIVAREVGPAVYVVADGKAVLRPARLGLRLPGKVEIAEGVRAGETVVTAGQLKLQDGTPVQVRPAAPEPAPAPARTAADAGREG